MKNQPLWIRREPDPEPEPVTEPMGAVEEQPWPCEHGPYLKFCPLPRRPRESKNDWYKRLKIAGLKSYDYDACFGKGCGRAWIDRNHFDELMKHNNGEKRLRGFSWLGTYLMSWLDSPYYGSNHKGSPW